jgi:hypothetical protein
MKKIWKKCFRQKKSIIFIINIKIQCKQRYIRTSLPYRSGFNSILHTEEESVPFLSREQ